MPIAAGFDSKVMHLNATPIAASDINTMLTAENGDDYSCTSIEFIDANNAVLLFLKSNSVAYGEPVNQKVNLVTASQAAIDTDKATEVALNFWPTGIFVTPGGGLLILYQELGALPL